MTKDVYSKILLNFNDYLTKDECDNVWNAFGDVELITFNGEKCALFKPGSYLKLNSEIPVSSSHLTYEFWIYLKSGHFGFSSASGYRNDVVCFCSGKDSLGFFTGINSYYPGYETIAGSQGSNLISENSWHYISLSVDNNFNHFIAVDGSIVFSGKNSRGYALNFLPVQLGSVPTWSWNKATRFDFSGYIRGFSVSSGVAKYKFNYLIQPFPLAPDESSQNFPFSILLPPDKSGSYLSKADITYFFKLSFSKPNYQSASMTLSYGLQKNSLTSVFSQKSFSFTYNNFSNSQSILSSLANSEISSLKDFLDSLIGSVSLPPNSTLKFVNSISNAVWFINQSFSLSIVSVGKINSVSLSTSYYSDSNPNPILFSQKSFTISSENFSSYYSNLISIQESELNNCKKFLMSLLGPVSLPDSKYSYLHLLNGDTIYLKLSYSISSVSPSSASVSYSVHWDYSMQFNNLFSTNTLLILPDNYSKHTSLLSSLGNAELLKCSNKFSSVSPIKLISNSLNFTSFYEKNSSPSLVIKNSDSLSFLHTSTSPVSPLKIKSNNSILSVNPIVN